MATSTTKSTKIATPKTSGPASAKPAKTKTTKAGAAETSGAPAADSDPARAVNDDGMITETIMIDGEPTVVRRPAAKTARGGKGKSGTRAKTDTTTGANTRATTQADAEPDASGSDAHGAPVRATRGEGAKTAKGKPQKTSRTRAQTAGVTLADLAERFLKNLEALGKSRGTVFSYSIDLGLATRHFGDDRDIGTIGVDDVADYFACDAVTKTRTGKAKSNLTIDKTRRVLRQALQFAASEGLIAEAPIPMSALPPRRRKDVEAQVATNSTEG